ncbi:hypothetical protein ACXWTF_05105 [Thiomicrolovo sp. ZZH C-3]
MKTLISILSHHSNKEEVLETDSLVEDLGIDGDTAEELYFDLLDNYGIDLKDLKSIDHYFHSEGELIDVFLIFKWFFYKLGLRGKPTIRKVEPLFVSDLLAFVQGHTNA